MGIMSWNLYCCITFTLLTCFLSSSAGVSGLGQFQQQQQVVTLRHPAMGGHLNLSFIDEMDQNCSAYCSDQVQYNSVCINQGCRQWKTALKEGCGSVCSGSEANYKDLYACQQGCSKLVEDYYERLAGLIGIPDPPTLIAVSLKSTSLRLSWEGSLQSLPYLVFTIQRRFYLRNQPLPWESVTTEPLNQTYFTVQGLKPYMEYQFRVGWILSHDCPPLYSHGSNAIETLPQGYPTAPEITSVQPGSNTSVAVTWSPPSQPNGRLVAYILRLQSLSEGLLIKEIPMNQNPRGYIFSGLLPNTNYTLTISAQNVAGEGDSASVSFVTPQSIVSNDISKNPEPRLLIQGIQDVYLQPLEPFSEPDLEVYSSNENITAMAVHVKRKWVFISLASGQVIRTELDRNQSLVILPKEKLDIWVTSMSVDWLNQKLYMVGKKKKSSTWLIKKCDLNGDRFAVVYSSLGAQPLDFIADPYTGYMYWVSLATYSWRPGLYKMDLIGEDVNRPLPLSPIIVYPGSDLGPFTIDFANYRILLVHRGKNTILSVSLDGGDTDDIRRNTQSPQFGDAYSLAIYNGIFYWTTGDSLVIEDYNEAQDNFYQNSFEVSQNHQPCSRLIILHPDLQPIPRPMAPPRVPQVIFSQTQARVIWRPPATIANLGEGAWRDWKYQIRLSDNTSISNISETEYTLENLTANTYYSIQVLAYSESGRSPLSVEFRGRTLRSSPFNVSFLWGSDEGVFTTTALGAKVEKHVSSRQWQGPGASLMISSLAYYESSIFFSLSNGSVYAYDGKTSTEPIRLRGISFAQSIAYDYIGGKLYWSNPKKQTILRCSIRDIDSGNPKLSSEWLQLVTMGKEIAIDSSKASLIWTTGHTIEISKLNGYNHNTIHSVGLFSGTRIVGITLDTEQSRIYWISQSFEGSTIMRLNYDVKSTQIPTVVSTFPETNILGPVRYYNDRLIWLQGTNEAVITDLNGAKNSVITVNSISNISTIHVRDQSSQRFPSGFSKGRINVLPNSVLYWSIAISGKWNNFTIRWLPVNNTNYGKIFYQVTVNNYIAKPVTQPFILFQNATLFKPYTEVEISIVALTYWTSSKPTVVKTRTPSGKPTEPRNPRIFLEKLSYPYSKQNRNITKGELRWDAILEPNGLILGYMVNCWKDTVKSADCYCLVDLKKLSCELQNLSPTSTYQFAVQGYTDAGAGSWSRRVQSNPRFSNPVPKLLLAANDKLQMLDIDRNQLDPVPSGYLTPMTATYIAADDRIYWFDDRQDLLQSTLDGNNKTRVYSLDSLEASHLTVDWIARRLYWIAEVSESATNYNAEEKYRIMSLDLNETPLHAHTILKSHTAIKSVIVNPFRNSILWTTSKRNGIMTLYTSITDGSLVDPFLSRDPVNCNCSTILSVGEAIAFDPTGYRNIKQGIILTDHQSVWLTDDTGCKCHQLVNITAHSISRPMNPPFRIAADEHHVYWASNYLFASEKPGTGITELNGVTGPSGVREIHVISPSVQPFPGLNCLIPGKLDPGELILLNASSHTFHVQLPLPKLTNCSSDRISMPTPKYEVYYGTVNENGIAECTPSSILPCRVLKTTKTLLDITNLHPYTHYTVFVTVTNFYALREGFPPLISTPRMLRSAPGAPMAPKLLRLETLTPMSVRVVWARPDKLNGEKVWYEVRWQKTSTSSTNSPKRDDRNGSGKWEMEEAKGNQNQTEHSMNITGLHAQTNYSVWVDVFSEKGDTRNQSEVRVVETFPNPNNLTLVSATPHTLSLFWKAPNDTSILSHQIVYRPGWSSVFNETEFVTSTIPGRTYNVNVVDLKPKTVYGFRITVWYKGDHLSPYTWPREGQFDMETKADKPSSPGIPVARGIGKSLYEVSWEKADENGGVVNLYNLECKLEVQTELETETRRRKRRDATQTAELAQKLIASDRQKPNQSDWFVVYNGTESRWQVKDLDLSSHYIFRVRARNFYGWGEYSQESIVVVMSSLTIVAESQHVGAILGIIALGILILGTFGFLFIYAYHRKLKEKPALINSLSSERRPGVELATLRELPVGVHQSNILYAAGEFFLDLELAGVPKFTSNQIRQTKFLGKGAFGEVYEGIARRLSGYHDSSSDIRVAIKSLRKGASAKERSEFIEEAKRMTQYCHPHILQLIGICIDTDPCCLLLELMDGGDLLSYLRSNRNRTNPNLTLGDLLSMCVDVANGCVYLEELHFVHRDLAARNCLVRFLDSDPNPSQAKKHTIVKIGDFGLARDVYRNDYYKIEGERLLPVRWMSPESLVDGVFTTQSDIWAFGVLLWEITTLGQQPYQLRSNLEVHRFVTSEGGTLRPPSSCPKAIGNLMMQCWEYYPENRPSFKDCLVQLENLLQNYNNGLYPAEGDNPSNSTPLNSPLDNTNEDMYWQEQQEASEQDSDSVFGAVSAAGLGTDYVQRSPVEHLKPRETSSESSPKYLEVVCGEYETNPRNGRKSDCSIIRAISTEEDGYEIPLPRVPGRNPRCLNNLSHCEVGLPSPPYWNTKPYPETEQSLELQYFVPFRKLRHSTAGESESETESHYRNLLQSSNSEEADVEMDNECGSSDEQSESPTNPNSYIFQLNLNPALLQAQCRNNEFRRYEVPVHLTAHDTNALPPEVPADSSREQDYDYARFHNHYHNNRPFINVANSG